MAIRFGLSESDIEALEVLIDTGSTTAGTLSDLMGLTTGAVTRVIDRLEQAGYVRRVPDPADRRRVIVEVVPDKVAGVQATLGRVGEASTDEIGHYSEAELAVINDFLTRMAAITREEATALRQTPDQRAAATEHSAPIGGLSRARLLFRSGAHELLLRGSPDIGELYQAKFEGPVPQVRLRDGVVTVQYKGGWKWDWKERRADLSINSTIPWDVEVIGGTEQAAGQARRARPPFVRADGWRRPAPSDPRPPERPCPHPPDRRRQQHPDRTARGRPGPHEAARWRGQHRVRPAEARAAGRL